MISWKRLIYISLIIPFEVSPREILPCMNTLSLYASSMLLSTSCIDIVVGKKLEKPLLASFGIPFTLTCAPYTPLESGAVSVPGTTSPGVLGSPSHDIPQPCP
jgi:hypothetical protein